MNNPFTIVPRFLRNPAAFFESVSQGEAIGLQAIAFALSAVVFLAAFGFVTGLSHSILRDLSSAVKMPILFIATIFFCLPAFHFFSLVLGTKLSIAQVTTVVLSAIGVTAFLLLGLSSITLFFVLTSNNFAFFRLLAVIFVAVSGSVGVSFLWRGMDVVESNAGDSYARLRRLLLWMWFALYGFIGSQMTWRLSPFVNDPSLPFEVIRPTRDDFYMDAARAFVEATGLQVAFTDANAALMAAGCLIPLTALTFVIGMTKDVARKSKLEVHNAAARPAENTAH